MKFNTATLSSLIPILIMAVYWDSNYSIADAKPKYILIYVLIMITYIYFPKYVLGR